MSLNGSLQSDGHTSTQSSMKFIGFRDVELVRDPLPDGETFYFRVNGDAVSHMHTHTCTHMHTHTHTHAHTCTYTHAHAHTHTHTHACTHTHTSLSSCRHSCFCQRRQPDSPGCLWEPCHQRIPEEGARSSSDCQPEHDPCVVSIIWSNTLYFWRTF